MPLRPPPWQGSLVAPRRLDTAIRGIRLLRPRRHGERWHDEALRRHLATGHCRAGVVQPQRRGERRPAGEVGALQPLPDPRDDVGKLRAGPIVAIVPTQPQQHLRDGLRARGVAHGALSEALAPIVMQLLRASVEPGDEGVQGRGEGEAAAAPAVVAVGQSLPHRRREFRSHGPPPDAQASLAVCHRVRRRRRGAPNLGHGLAAVPVEARELRADDGVLAHQRPAASDHLAHPRRQPESQSHGARLQVREASRSGDSRDALGVGEGRPQGRCGPAAADLLHATLEAVPMLGRVVHHQSVHAAPKRLDAANVGGGPGEGSELRPDSAPCRRARLPSTGCRRGCGEQRGGAGGAGSRASGRCGLEGLELRGGVKGVEVRGAAEDEIPGVGRRQRLVHPRVVSVGRPEQCPSQVQPLGVAGPS
mmetsp:Transcript_77490/g.224852  ORF Transcript_77490/g.224852 Transcript_77490/m.224852 type:complete len:420 (-) Transcript_77490:1721-2980(-)